MTLVNITDTSDKQKTVVALTADEDFLISEAEKELNAAQQKEAFGEYTTGPKASKQKAAEMLAIDHAQAIIDNSIFALRNNQSTVENEKRFFKDTEALADKEYLVDVALPILAADNAVADAELDNPDDVGSLTDEDALFTAEDRAKYDMETEILNKAEQHLVEKGLKGMALGIAQRFVPFVQSYKDWRVSSKDTAHVLPTETRKKQRQKFQEAKRMMSATEYGKFLNREFNRLVGEGHDRIAIQEYFEDMFTYNTRFEDVMQVLDFLSVGKLVKGGPKIGRTIKAGNKKKALEAIKAANTEEKLGHTIPTIAKPAEGPVQSLSAIVEDTEMLDVSNTKALEAIKETLTFQHNPSDEVLKPYVEIASREIQAKMPKAKKKIFDSNLLTVERAEDGTHDMVLTLGNGLDGTSHFKTEEAAKEFIKNKTRFLEGEYDVIHDSEGYLIKARTKVPFTGRVIDEKAYQKTHKPGKLKGLGRYIFGRLGVPTEFHEANNVAVNSVARLRQIGKDMLGPIDALKGKDKEAFEVLIERQRNNEQWLSASDLAEEGFSESVIEANKAFRDISDVEYIIENAGLRKKMNGLGYKLIQASPEDTGFVGKVVEDVKDISSATFKDHTTGKVYTIGEMTAEHMEELKKADKVFVLSHAQEVDITSEIPIKYHILSRGTANVSDLPAFMVEYVAGGRRFYNTGTLFAKLPRTLNIGDKRTILKPKTLFAGLDKASLKTKVDEINKALDEFAKYTSKEISLKELNRRLDTLAASATHFKASSLKELQEVLGKNLDPTLRVELVEDGQTLAQVRKLQGEGITSLVDDDLFFSSSMYDLIEDNGRGFMRRGTHLKDIDGSLASTISAVDTAKRTLSRLVNTQAYDEYNRMYAAELRRLFGDVIDPYDFAHMSDAELLKGARAIDLKEASHSKSLRNKINAFKHMQKKWQLITEQPTEFDKLVTTYAHNLAQKLGETLPGTFGRGTQGYENIANLKPVEQVRSLAFHQFLGCFNIKQIFTQALGGLNAIALEPLHGLHAATLYPALRMAMTTDNVESLGLIKKAVARLGGINTEDFWEMTKALKKIGAYSGEDVQVFVDARNILNTNSFKRASTFFFREGERFNSLVAYGAAFLKHKKLLGHAPKTYDELAKMSAYGQELYLNMSRASTTPFQKGTYIPSHLFAQFTSYPIRFLEALFNKRFNLAQRTSLLATNIACFGAAGVLGRDVTNWIWQKGKEFLGTDGSDLPAVVDVLKEGLWQPLLKEYGIDINVTTFGPGVFDKLWQIAVNGEIQLPSISALGSLYDTTKAISKFLYPNTNDLDTLSAMKYLAYESKALPVLRNGTKGLLALSSGKLFTSNYRLIKNDVSSLEAVLYGLGFKSNTEQVYSDAIKYIINKNETVDDAVKDVATLYRKFLHSGSRTDAEQYSVLYKAILQSLPQGWKADFDKKIRSIYRESPLPVLEEESRRAFIAGDKDLYETIKENM